MKKYNLVTAMQIATVVIIGLIALDFYISGGEVTVNIIYNLSVKLDEII